MARPSIVPKLLEALEPYLAQKISEWDQQGSGSRRPTLPHHHGKVSVRDIVKDLKLPVSNEQYFYGKDDLYKPINLVAAAQGLEPIKSRSAVEAEGDAAAQKIRQQAKDNKRVTENLAQMAIQLAAVTKERDQLRARLELIQSDGAVIRSGSIKE